MIVNFPTPYPDELFYSCLARYHVRSGNESMSATFKELFVNKKSTISIDLPCKIELFVSQIMGTITVEKIIYEHSLFPFFEPFLPNGRDREIIDRMRGNESVGINFLLGASASTIPVPTHLKYCLKCNENDLNLYGENYWHRLHQIAGVMVCPDHRIPLRNSKVKRNSINRELIDADEENCHSTNQMTLNRNEIEILSLIAEDIKWLLNNKINKNLNWLHKQYLEYLKKLNLSSIHGRINKKELQTQLENYYGVKLLRLMGCEIKSKGNNAWLDKILREDGNTSFPPLKHILIIRFLTKEPIQSFFEKEETYYPFGSGPWLCLNRAASHYNKLVIESIDVKISTNSRLPIGTFKCECGFVYSRTGPDCKPEDKYSIGKVLNFGPIWVSRLKYLVENKKMSLNEVSQEMDASPTTIKKYALANGLNHCWRLTRVTREINEKRTPGKKTGISLRDDHREKWITLIQSNPLLTKKQLRALASSSYTWLTRHDKDWLIRNSPKNSSLNLNRNLVDWNERDKKCLKKIKDAYNQINLLKEKTNQITMTYMAIQSQTSNYIPRQLDKLPETKAYLNSIVESHEQFQIRRLNWAAWYLNENSEIVTRYSILKTATIKQNFSDKVNQHIQSLVEEYSSLLSS